MSPHDKKSSARAPWLVLLACAAVGVIVLALVKSGAPRRPPALETPLNPPTTARTEHAGADPSRRADADAVQADSRPVWMPARPADESGKLLSGRVEGQKRGPVAGSKVRLALEHDGKTQQLGEIATDPEGEFTFGGAELADAFGSDAFLAIDVEARGYQPGHGRYGLAALSAKTGFRATITLAPGALVEGRVVDARGAGLRGAEVTLLVPRVTGSVTTYTPVVTVESTVGGRFALGFDSSGDYRVTARASGVGTGVVEHLALESGVDHVLADVVLKGGAPIEGRALSADGQPMGGFELWAIDGSYANEPDALARAAMRVAADERDDGLALAKTSVDADGRFSLSGLRPGHYALRSPDRQIVLEPRQARYEPGTKDVQLVLSSQLLVVRVQTSAGKTARGAGVRITDLSTLPDGSYEPSNTRARGVDSATGVAAFTLDPETPVAVQAFEGKRRSAEQIVTLRQGEWLRDLTLTLDDRTPDGRVRVDLMGEDGAPLTSLRVDVHSSATGIAIAELGTLESDGQGLLPPLPAGSYRLVIGYAPGTDRDHFLVHTTEPVVVRANQETVVSLRARRGGRVRLTLDLRGAPPPGFGESAKLPDTERRDRFGTRIALAPESGGAPTVLQFRLPTGPGLVTQLLPGESYESVNLFAAGAYSMVIESVGFTTTAPSRIQIEAGLTRDFALTVSAR